MARITVEDSLEEIPNRFALVLIAAERTKQLLKGADLLIEEDRNNKEVVTSLREIAAGHVQADLSAFDPNAALGTSQVPPATRTCRWRATCPRCRRRPAPRCRRRPSPAADDDLPPEA